MKAYFGMLHQELLDGRGFVCRKIIQYDVNLAGSLRLSDQPGQESDELRGWCAVALFFPPPFRS